MPPARQRAASTASDIAMPAPPEVPPAPTLAEAQHRLLALSPDLLSIISLAGEFRWLNPAWETLLGRSLATLIGQSCFDYIHPDDHEATIAEARRLASGGPTITFENRFRTADGSYRWLAWNAAAAVDNLVYAVARDITDQRRTETALQESERRYRTVIASLEEGIIVQDADGRMITANPAVARIFGRPS
ncbi:MAG: PAS domain S-box protein, partial [Thermomicrobiales bacterium]